MAERKVISKYYPPDFDPSKLKRQRKTQNTVSKLESVRLSSPFSMRCNGCGEFIYKGRKFNARKQMTNERYLNIPIVRLFIRCTACSSEIAFDTDAKNEDYKNTSGATRNFEPWREAEPTQETESERLDRLEREEWKQDAITALEAKATSTQTKMAIADALDDIRIQNARREIRIRSNIGRNAQMALGDEDQDEEATRKAFGNDTGELVRRLHGEDVDAGEYAKDAVPGFERQKRRKKDYSAALGIKRNMTA
ncbi:DUF572-domain-containing protein, partial [Aureobasidium melanogenum]